MVKGGKGWPVDGVSDEARLAAEEAAALEGVDLGDWIEAAIREAAEADAPVSAGDIVAAIEALRARIGTSDTNTRETIVPLRERLARLSQQVAEIEQAAADPDALSGDGANDTMHDTVTTQTSTDR